MGYWNASQAGSSLQAENTGLIWGDAPADAIDFGMERVIGRFRLEKQRLPSVKELDALKYAADKPKELVFAIGQAVEVFTRDVGRAPAPEEILAGLSFADSEISLEAFERMHPPVNSPFRVLTWVALSTPVWLLIGWVVWRIVGR